MNNAPINCRLEKTEDHYENPTYVEPEKTEEMPYSLMESFNFHYENLCTMHYHIEDIKTYIRSFNRNYFRDAQSSGARDWLNLVKNSSSIEPSDLVGLSKLINETNYILLNDLIQIKEALIELTKPNKIKEQ